MCHGGLTAGALAVMEDEPELAARTVHNAIHNVTRSMAVYAPRGSYPEGPGYWAYGTSYNVVLIAVLESALGTDFALSKAPGFDVTGQYPGLVTGPSGLTFNYADGALLALRKRACFGLRGVTVVPTGCSANMTGYAPVRLDCNHGTQPTAPTDYFRSLCFG